MSSPLSPRAALVFAGLAVLPLTPWMSKYYLLLAFDALLFGAVAMSLDLLIGYTGLVSFGHAAFFGLGAYSAAVLLERGVTSLWLSLALSLIVVGLYAFLVSYFATTRRGIYFALLTLIFAEVVYTVFRYTQSFGGSDGIQGLPAPSLLPGVLVDTPARNYYLVLSYLLFAYLVCRMLVSSHFGRVLAAIRENEDRARFLGYDVQRYKMGVCMISAVLTGLAGALYPGRAAYATPDLLHWSISGEFLIMVMIGGLGTLVGPIIGGAFFIVLQEKVSSYVQWYSIVVGLVLVFIVLFVPKGLLGFRGALRLHGFRRGSA
ncbi:MAG: branched-chain amino acid ABC transporter permease [Candidatus Rokuibacteriota bacterium]